MRTDRSVRELLDEARSFESTDPLRARVAASQARNAARSNDDTVGVAEATYRLASIAFNNGSIDESFSLAIEARDLAVRAGSDLWHAFSLNIIGMVNRRAGNYSEALDACLTAISLYRSTGHLIVEGQILSTLASVYQSLGDSVRAIETFEAALTANQGLDMGFADAISLANISEARTERGEYMIAVGFGEHALSLASEHLPSVVPEIERILGRAYAGLGNRPRAEELFGRAITTLTDGAQLEAGDCGPLAEVYLARGRMHSRYADWNAALSDLRAALVEAERSGDLATQLKVHEALAGVYKESGDFRSALLHQEQRFDLNQRLFNEGTDLRIRTLQVVHDTAAARQETEILNLRTNELEAMVQNRTGEMENFQLEALERLAILGEFRDTDTGEHTVRVGDLAAEIAHQLELEEEWCERLRLAARLHDIGKVAIPDSILLKPGPLTTAEFDIMKTHTTLGARILSGSSSPLVQLAEQVALNHHERWDGTGYPNGLSAQHIPLSGRITAVADVFDALTDERLYKNAWSTLDAAQYVVDGSGMQFDPMVVAAFERVIARRHPGLAVKPAAGSRNQRRFA